MNVCFHTSTVKCENCMTEEHKMSGSFRYATNVTAQPHNADKNLSSSTPTEQDDELDRYAMSIVHMVGSIQHEKLPETITSSAFVDLRQASNDEAIDAIKQLITADRKRVALEARIDTATDILYGFSRTYKQEVTDSDGNVYASDSHGYISKYEVQELIAELKQELEKL